MSFQVPIDPNAVLDFGCNWASWLPTGVTISTSAWSITPTGPTLANETNSTTATVIYVSGCTVGVTYTLTNRIVTSGTPSRTDDRSIVLVCRER